VLLKKPSPTLKDGFISSLEQVCFIYLSKREVRLKNLRPLINAFLSTQPEHLLLILAKEE
ncbi:hypothetical protein Lwor_1891, partial [Legionella worsleiensis]